MPLNNETKNPFFNLRNILTYFLIPVIIVSFIFGLTKLDKFSIELVIYILSGIVSFLLLFKRQWIFSLMIIALFLEGHIFSFNLGGARIRSIQILEVFLLVYLIISFLMNKIKFKQTIIDWILLLYIFINSLAIINSVWIERSLKINVLLISGILLYYLLVNTISSEKIFNKFFNLFLMAGVLQVLYGLYQVSAGMLNYAAGINLPIGYLGLIHKEYIGAPWGRPYGTFVEPDWYGAVCMFYSLLFISLYYTKISKKKYYYMAGLGLSLAGLFFSFVRAAWIGFFAGVIILLILKNKTRISKISLLLYIKKFIYLLLLLFVVLASVPKIREVLFDRIAPADTTARFDFNNIRISSMKASFQSFLRHPIIGNGPGSASYNHLSNKYGEIAAKNIILNTSSKNELESYDPNIVMTVIADTGMTGLFLFILFLLFFIKENLINIPLINNEYAVIASGSFAGIIGLFLSYIFTHGFWISFTWVFIAVNLASLRLKNHIRIGK